MPLYNEQTTEQTIRITEFDRAYKVTVNYPNAGTPSIRFDLERIERRNGVDRSKGIVGNFEETLNPDNQDTVFDVIDQEGNVVGSAKYEDVQALLYSLFFHLAP